MGLCCSLKYRCVRRHMAMSQHCSFGAVSSWISRKAAELVAAADPPGHTIPCTPQSKKEWQDPAGLLWKGKGS